MSSKKKDILTLAVRLIVGGIFITAGWMKVSAMAATLGFFSSLGIPAFLVYIVSYSELIGGILVVLGLWTCAASFILAVIMAFAMWYSRSMGFQGIMAPLAILGGLLSIMASDAGAYAVRLKKGSDQASVASI
ncbi:DoxX family protein [Candidatus Parcubacteria bacterium]|nr:DoxX family protein [Candidatus Parcubacteria bacterium]